MRLYIGKPGADPEDWDDWEEVGEVKGELDLQPKDVNAKPVFSPPRSWSIEATFDLVAARKRAMQHNYARFVALRWCRN